MKPKVSLITLGVTDIQRSKKFYLDLGFPIPEGEDTDMHVMFKMEGSYLALFPREELAKGAGIPLSDSAPSGIVLAHNVGSKEEVDSTMEEVRGAGAEILVEAKEVFWGGYSGYFKDPDGHVWSIAYNPFTDLT